MWRDASGRFRAFLRQLGADLRHLLLAAVPAERLFRLRTLDPDRVPGVAGDGARHARGAPPLPPPPSRGLFFSSRRSPSWSTPTSPRPTPPCCCSSAGPASAG